VFGHRRSGSSVLDDADRRLPVAYVMNELAPFPIVTHIAAALVQRVYDVMGL
jgi:hypothetical protein